MARKRWIQGAIKRKGQLHRDLGVPQGKKIPRGKLQAAAKRKGKVGQRARLALTLGKMSGGGGRKSSSSKKGTHRVRAHHRTLSSGRKVKVRSHRRKRK